MTRPGDQRTETTAELSPGGSERVRPYPWSALPELESRHVEWGNRLLRLLPRADREQAAARTVAERLTELTGRRHVIDPHRLHIHHDPGRPTFGDAFATRFHLPPDPEHGALAVDRSLVERWLEALPEIEAPAQPFGPPVGRDFGIATYLCLEAFRHLESVHGAPPVVFPTEPPLHDVLAERLAGAQLAVEAAFVVTVDGGRHLARLWIPANLLANLEEFDQSKGSARLRTRALLEGSLGGASLDFAVSLGRTSLPLLAFRRLGRGDVLLLETHGFAVDSRQSEAGNAGARLSIATTGRPSYLPGHLVAGADRWQFRLDTATPRTETETMSTHDEQASADAPDEPGPTAMLETPEVTVDVRLGTATLTLREVGSLSAGQVLRLDRRVGADAELVVDGRVVGRGELVDVDGEIGVRIRHVDP